MAVKKKVKISNTKRSQHLKHKKNFTKPLKKKVDQVNQGTSSAKKNKVTSKKVFGKPSVSDRPNPNKSKKSKYPVPQKRPINEPPEIDEPDDEDGENVQDILDMIEDDNNNDGSDGDDGNDEDGDEAHVEQDKFKGRKRKRDATGADNEDENKSAKHFENQYAKITLAEDSVKKRMVSLLPFKTKAGEIIPRETEAEDDDEEDIEAEDDLGEEEEEGEAEAYDSDDDIVKGEAFSVDLADASKKAVSTADLLILREQEIARQKYRIGIICSGILEKPEDKMKNFSALFELMDERTGEQSNLITVRKIAAMSLLEVFKDILPEYRIGQLNLKMQTVRKNTMERITYENTLLQQYKKYLQKLEKMSSLLTKRQTNNRRYSLENIKLGEVAVTCLCELLIAHPYFNFGQNIAQLLVYLINSNFTTARTQILKCFQEIFKNDKKFDLTLFIVRRLNHLIKTKSNNVHVEILTCLLSLQIKSINLDAEKDNELKQKKLEAHKARLMNMSKKEKKRHKRLSQLDKELQETKAEENKQTKHYKLTEITKMVFTIYFRILKNDPNSQLLSATLEGLAEFAHVINLDFFSDLVEVLNNIMENEDLGYREQLHCIQTVFTILSGQGEVLNIDPLRFYGHLYRNLLVVNGGKNHEDLLIILKTLHGVLIKRRKNITHHRLLAFVKRIATLSMQLLHHGTIGCLGIVKTVLQLTSSLEIILDTDASVGSGRYDPELNDPEYCNANCTALYELATLCRHYHPTVRKMANHIAAGVPASGDGSLNPEIGKLTALELYKQFDSSEMSFNPAIPTPKKIELNKEIKGRHYYIDDKLETYCRQALHCPIDTAAEKVKSNFIDFYSEYRHGIKK